MALWADQYGIRTTDSAAPFIQLLCQSPDFRSAFIDHVLNDPNPQLGFQIRVLLPELRNADPAYFEEIAIACAKHVSGDVAWGAAHGVCVGPWLQKPVPEDVVVITHLAHHPSSDVRRLAVDGASRVGRNESFQVQAAAIISSVDIEGDALLARSVSRAFGRSGMPIGVLTDEQIRSVLSHLVSIDRLDDEDSQVFFARIARQAPGLLFEFFFERLKKYGLRGRGHSGFTHWDYLSPRSYFKNVGVPVRLPPRLTQTVKTLLTVR
jgi:hypothetical protein